MHDMVARTVCIDIPLLASYWWVRSQPGVLGCSGGGREVAGLMFVGGSCGSEQVADKEVWLLHGIGKVESRSQVG